MKRVILLALLLPHMAHAHGVVTPAVTQANLKTTVCASGYTAKVRPATSYTNKLKGLFLGDEKAARSCIKTAHDHTGDWRGAVTACYKTGKKLVDSAELGKYELDHFVPLAVGGEPYDIDNLVLQSWDKAKSKDVDEKRAQTALCKGAMNLREAQDLFLWRLL